ncbi:hypothetical protein FB451DRAFT_1554169 [Mycena latifolia]|nr:hypothetical protein FB451DRAFT_1554169 [Mycena latifolia]
MHAFKFISVSALCLLALVQGGVAQDELVPLGGVCGSIIGTKPCASGTCCYRFPDYGVCQLKCGKKTA